MPDFHELTDDDWQKALAEIESGNLAEEDVPHAIARLAKPFNRERIEKAASSVAAYLSHPYFLARHEALWFLCFWGELPGYTFAALHSLQHDTEPINRAFAARCLGLSETELPPNATEALIASAASEIEDEEVRTSAYGSVIHILKGSAYRDLADKFMWRRELGVEDFDWDWLLVDQQHFLRMRS